MKIFNIEEVTLTSHPITSYRKINITSEKIINYRVTFPSNHHCCQINIIAREIPGISVVIHFYLFLRRNNKIFKSLKPAYSYACILTLRYQRIGG